MYLKIEDKELKKLLEDIDKLIAKIIKFNVNNISTLSFCFDKVNLKVIPIVSHFSSPQAISDVIKEHKIFEDNDGDESLISKDDLNKFIDNVDPLSIIHNVILSTEEIDLSLERDDRYLYTKPINIFVLKRFKEFLISKKILYIDFYYDEILNSFKLESIRLAEEENPIVIRQKNNYLNTTDLNNNFFDYSRNFWLKEDIKLLCRKYQEEENKRTKYILTKEEQEQEELKYKIDDTEIIITKEFLKANAKSIDFIYQKYETLEDIKVISVLLHIVYSNNHQYIFYQYYEI